MLKLIVFCAIVTTVLSGNYDHHHHHHHDDHHHAAEHPGHKRGHEHSSSYQSFNIKDDHFHSSPVHSSEEQKHHKHSIIISGEDDSRESDHSKPKVCAKVGCIRGKVEPGRKNPYDAFYGIPYAEPPVGKLRLENPLPHKGWKGYWDATFQRSDCTQRNIYIHTQPIVGSEDCLYLNVYRPHKRPHKHLPVMVFIHGGSFLSSSSSSRVYGPEYLMDNGEVILVTINYRLGMFGFLCSGDGAVKGNFGLKDQQLALKWIAANIEAFGGDPHSVTLVGIGAGAISSHLHMMNPVSSELFHRIVLMSGTAISHWAFSYDWAHKYRLSAKYTGEDHWDSASTYQLAQHFKKLDPLSLVLGVDRLFAFTLTPLAPLRPCIEDDWEGAFLKADPRKLWAEGKYSQKPILIGTTSEDGTLAAPITTNHTRLHIYNEYIEKLLPIQFDFDPKYVGDVIKSYLGKDYIDEKNVGSYYQLMEDRTFVHPVITVVNQHVKNANIHKSPIFIYEMGFKGPHTFVEVSTGLDINLGVSHFDQLLYLFNMPEHFPTFDPHSPEGLMAEAFVKTFVHFATHGEVKEWAPFEPCNIHTNKPFCDRQIFKRLDKHGPDTYLLESGCPQVWGWLV
ncbi:juvenile hormone esterase-like [Lutzomyia longipalpis]|uniref:juvenile hormone esterase-like n=1 Tax=Lutzomyia longipalpis TaxID=7200 RepID=UPI002483F233|nr:juvenile hormone esterase-like [Lutzomyia longipalpis]